MSSRLLVSAAALVAGAALASAQDAPGGTARMHDQGRSHVHTPAIPGRAQGPLAGKTTPQDTHAAPATTGQGDATPAPDAAPPPQEEEKEEEETPDSGASSRVPAGAPQRDYDDDTPPAAGDHR